MTVFALLGSVSLPQAQAEEGSFSLKLDSGSVKESDRLALESFIREAQEHLPPQFKKVVAREVTVRFTPLDSTTEFLVPPCGSASGAESLSDQSEGGSSRPGSQIRGQVRTHWFQSEKSIHEIELNSVMLPEILKGREASQHYACGHRTLYDLALATLVHELSHLYDFSDYWTPERTRLWQRCEDTVERGEHPDPKDRIRCQSVLNKMRVVSDAPSFMSVMDWKNGEMLNRSTARSVDPYERTSTEESFAVNMEYFLLDPEYACRKPVAFEYLRDHFGFDPFPGRTCRVSTEIALAQDSLSGGSRQKTVDLDPSRIYQIHFLFASEGPMMMSRWGHSMFRIVMCSPSRKTVGPECLKDIEDQVVVSFRANPGDWNVSAWQGLTGGYPSQLFLYKLYPDIVNEYTVDEFRNLISLPLKLSDAEKTRFVHRVLEESWGYQGRYYFLSENCATEALRFLQTVIWKPEFQDWELNSPIGLYEALGARGYLDPGLLADKNKATSQTYLFASQKNIYEGSFNLIRKFAPEQVMYPDFDDYVNHSRAQDRMALYQKLIALPKADVKRMAGRFYVVETFILRKERTAFLNRTMKWIEVRSTELKDKLERLLALTGAGPSGGMALGGSGIPTLADEQNAAPETPEQIAAKKELDGIYDEMMAFARQNQAQEVQELEQIQGNQSFFLKASAGKSESR